MTPLMGKSVLVFDGDPYVCLDIETELMEHGADVHSACSPRRAMLLVIRQHIDLAVLEYRSGFSCQDLATSCWSRNIPFVVVTSDPLCKIAGAFATVPKPLAGDDLISLLTGAARRGSYLNRESNIGPVTQ